MSLKYDIEVVEIIETDYYYFEVMIYLYEPSNKIGESYLISFKQNVYDKEKDEIYIEDGNIIKLILDTLFYYRIEDISGFSVVHS